MAKGTRFFGCFHSVSLWCVHEVCCAASLRGTLWSLRITVQKNDDFGGHANCSLRTQDDAVLPPSLHQTKTERTDVT